MANDLDFKLNGLFGTHTNRLGDVPFKKSIPTGALASALANMPATSSTPSNTPQTQTQPEKK